MPQPKDWLDKLFTRTTPNDKELLTHYGWQQGDTAYEWYGNGMLKSVRTPEGATIRFEYDALGRRTLKETHDTCHRYAWDGNVLLHEWRYDRREKPRMEKDELGRIRYDRQEPYTNLITWVYDGGSYTPVAKLTEEGSYTIVQDYMGTPIQALDSKGNVVWDCILDIYGDVLELRGERNFIPFRFQGQYEDGETGLYYNHFRYYSPDTGSYICQDPIRLAGNNPTLYGYVEDVNGWIDPFGLSEFSAALKTSNFWGKVNGNISKTSIMVKGAEVYKITNKVDIAGVNKGDYFHMDTLHKNPFEIELYDKQGMHKGVYDLDGNKIGEKVKGRKIKCR